MTYPEFSISGIERYVKQLSRKVGQAHLEYFEIRSTEQAILEIFVTKDIRAA